MITKEEISSMAHDVGFQICEENYDGNYLDPINSQDIINILNTNGFFDALWCLRLVHGHKKEIRLFAVWCARQQQHLIKDERSVNAINVAEKYANGEASKKELKISKILAFQAIKDFEIKMAHELIWAKNHDPKSFSLDDSSSVYRALVSAYRTNEDEDWEAAYQTAGATSLTETGSEICLSQQNELRRIFSKIENIT